MGIRCYARPMLWVSDDTGIAERPSLPSILTFADCRLHSPGEIAQESCSCNRATSTSSALASPPLGRLVENSLVASLLNSTIKSLVVFGRCRLRAQDGFRLAAQRIEQPFAMFG